mgnify:CR=1 FL=1|jgi:hypothetical protein
MTYQATIKHSSIAQARTIKVSDDLTQAKRQATAEFGAEQLDYTIVIFDERNETVASRRVADKQWTNA